MATLRVNSGSPEAVAEFEHAALSFASDEAGCVTGQSLVIDGSVTLIK